MPKAIKALPKSRSERMNRVFSVLSTREKSLKQIAKEAGYSVRLTRSTLNALNRGAYPDIDRVISYNPSTQCWKISEQWHGDKGHYQKWLTLRQRTSAETSSLEVDRALAILGSTREWEKVSILYEHIKRDYDEILATIPSPKSSNPQKANRGITLHG